MRILANENFPGDAVEALRSGGHDVLWVRTTAPGSSDPVVLAQAQAENRILITFDKDFGELAFHSKLPAASGIILFRISAPSSRYVAEFVARILDSRQDWAGHFSVIDDQRVRMTRLPS
jgi:predicted nuclease of predicted toxin-antitoxin system